MTTNKKPASQAATQLYLKRYIREHFLPVRFVNFGRNTKASKVIGFVGPRGSMKSLSASAMTIIDYLIPGYRVFSNMPIHWGIDIGGNIATYASDPLEKAELLGLNVNSALVFVDEVNLEFSEARRSMTNRNLVFNKLLQQVRKRAINLLYTVQHEMWIDSRLRWQTDMFIKCEDTLMRPGSWKLRYDWGEIGHWTVYDMRGLMGEGTFDTTQKALGQRTFYGKRWWNTFDTNLLQAEEEERYGVGLPKNVADQMSQPQFTPPVFDEFPTKLNDAITEVLTEYAGAGLLRAEKEDLMTKLEDRLDMAIIGNDEIEKMIRRQMRIVTKSNTFVSSGRTYYDFKRVFYLPTENITGKKTLEAEKELVLV